MVSCNPVQQRCWTQSIKLPFTISHEKWSQFHCFFLIQFLAKTFTVPEMRYSASLFIADPTQSLPLPHIHIPWYQEKTLPGAAPPVTEPNAGRTGRATPSKSSSKAVKLGLKLNPQVCINPLPTAFSSSQTFKPKCILSCHQAVSLYGNVWKVSSQKVIGTGCPGKQWNHL